MPENESINIDITGDVTEVTSSMEHALLSVEQVEEAAQRLTAQLAQIRTLTENPISLFDQDLATQIDLAERSANRLLDIRRNIDNSMSAESKESNTALLGNMITYTKQRVSDLNASVRQMNELQSAMGDLDASDFNQSMKALYSGLKIGLRQYAEAMSKAIGTQTPNTIIQGFMKTPEYKNVMAKAQSQRGNQHIFNDQNMQKYLASIATVAISPLTNNDYVDWTGQRRTINRVADLLPKQFSNIKLGRVATPTRDTTSSDFSEKLTKQELNTLQKIILQNQYVAREAEAARLITKHNGSIFMNKDATRGHVNAFAGNIAHLFSLGAMGLPMYGIEDIYDPKHLNSIASKTNKTITNARNMANVLSEKYGEWLDPAYYSTLPDLPQSASSWYRAGQVKASGRKDRMQFLELALGEIGPDGQITFANGEPKYTPVVQSEYQNYLSKQKGATPFTHNGQNENEVFVKLPDEEAIQAVLDKDPAKETAIADEIARVIGTRISHNGKNYSFSGLTKTHAIFTEESIKQEIEKHDPNFFANGESARVFDDYEAFAKAATYNRLQRVEGEDIAELYGVDLGKLNVVVGNFKNLTGLDGQNFISNKLVPEGFQGRSFGGKATYSPFSVEWLFKQYANYVDPKSGNLILPGANVNGGDLVIPPNVDLIEDFSNIKTNKQYNASLSSEELAAIRKQEIADKGLFAKTTYDAAHTNSRFMSAQLANTMAFTPEAQRYFTGVYMKELAAMQDPSAVMEKLFSGDDLLSQDVRRDITLLNSSEAQKRIQSYVNSLNEHIQKGDVLLPEGEGNYSMISAWLPDVINRTLVAGGKELTSEQEAASLKDDVAYFLREATEVGLARNPATVNGNVEAINKGADEYFKTLAKSIGVDESALYVDPSSVILKRLQGADEDGDTALVYAIKHSTNKVFADVMKATLVNTAEQYKKIRERANLTDEEIEKRAASQTDKVDLGGQQSFSLNDPKDLARFWLEGRKGVLGMGAASAVTRNAFQLGISDRVAKAVLMAEKNYDINSTRDKTARVYLSSADERAMLSEGAPISSIMNWAMKSRTLDENDKMVAFNQEAFNREYAEKIAKSNFTSVNSSTGMQHAIAIWWAKNVEGADVSGGFDWDSIFANLPQEFDKKSAAGQLSARLNDLRKQYIQGNFLVFGEKLEAELKQRSTDTYNEIRNQVNSDKSISERDRNAEIARRYKAAGGEVVGHILQYGLTESNLLKNAEAFADVQSIIDIFGKDNVYGSAVDYDSTYSQKRVDENNKKLEAQRQRKAELELEQQQHADANQQEITQLKTEIAELKAKDAADKANQLFDGNLIGTIADKEAKLESLQSSKRTELDQINAEIAKSESYQRQAFEFYRAQGEYDRIIGGAEEFSRGLWKSQRSKEAYINDIDPATLYYNKQSGIANAYIRQLNHLLEVGGYEKYQTDNIEEQINTIRQGVNVDFMDKSVSNAKHLAESLLARENATSIDYDKSEHELDGYLKKLKEAVDYQSKLLELSQEAKENGRSDDAKNLSEAARQTGEYIASGYQTAEKLRHNLYTQDISGEDKIITRLQRFTRDRNRRYSQSQFERQMLVNENDYEQYEQQYEAIAQRLDVWQARKRGLTASGQVDTENYKLATQEIERLSSALSECQKEMDGLTGASGRNKAAMAAIGETANRAIHQFASNVFHKAINEAQNFVVTYDDAMTEIQMVTLKTDSEIDTLGDGLIEKAVDLKAAVGDVTSAATSLYRQGLGDEAVDERLDDVIKFSTTAKVKTDDSIKLITVALSSGLVDTSEEAMDVISALGDSAATEAAQITKGLQKSMSAAKEVGVTYEQLVSMLTVITSKTQLSGSVAGTTMRNVMSRLARVSPSDMIYDEQGHAISGSDQARVLRSIGIDTYDSEGNFRGAYQILSDIGKVWGDLVDAQKQSVAYVLGGTEQFSNVAALMQGFSEVDENGVNLLDKYLEIAEQSDNATSEKYEHYMNSLAGAMTNVKNSWDALVNSATDSDPVIDVLNFFSDSVSGIAKFNDELEGMPSTIALVTAAIVGLTAAMKLNPAIGGAALAIGGFTAFGQYWNKTHTNETSDERQQYIEHKSTRDKLLTDAQEINNRRNSDGGLSKTDETAFEKTLVELINLGYITLDTGESLKMLTEDFDAASEAIAEAKNRIDAANKQEAEPLIQSNVDAINSGYQLGSTYVERYVQMTDDKQATLQNYFNNGANWVFASDAERQALTSAFNQLNTSGGLDDLVVPYKKSLWTPRQDYSWVTLTPSERADVFAQNNDILMNRIREYAFEDFTLNADEETSDTFGIAQKYKDQIAQILEYAVPGLAESGLLDAGVNAAIQELDAAYALLPDKTKFDARSHLVTQFEPDDDRTALDKFVAWLGLYNTSATTTYLHHQTPMYRVGDAADTAMLNNKIDTYGDAYARLSSAYIGSEGSTTQQRVESFVGKIGDSENGIKNLNAVIENNDEFAAILFSILEYDEQNDRYHVREGIGEDEWATLGRILAEQDARTHLDAYRGSSNVAVSASTTFEALKTLDDIASRKNLWENLSVDDATNKQLQSDLENVLGEDLLYRFVNGLLDEDGIAYAQSKIDAYEAESRIDPSNLQDEVLSLLKGLTGAYSEQMSQFASLQSEQTSYERALYSYDRVSVGMGTSEDYSQIGSALGLDADVVQNMARTEEGRKQLETDLKKRIGIYSDTLSQALLALLPEDAIDDLQADMDIDDLLTVFKENVSEDVYAIIETVLKSIGVTYNGKSFDADIDVDSGNISALQAASDYRTEYQGTHRDDEMLTYLKEAVANDVDLENYVQQNKSDEKWSDFYSNNPIIGSAVASYSAGEGIISKEQLLTLINEALYGGEKSSAFYDIGASAILGDNYEDGGLDWQSVLETYAGLKDTDIGDVLIGSMEETEQGADVINLLNEALKTGEINAEEAEKALKLYVDAMSSRDIAQITKFNKANKQIVDTFDALASGGSEAAKAYDDLFETTKKLSNAGWALEQYQAGDRSDKVTQILAEQFGHDQKALKKATDKQAELFTETMNASYQDQLEQLKANFDYNFGDISSYVDQATANMGGEFDVGNYAVNGKVDVSGLLKAFSEAGVIVDSTWKAVIEAMAEAGATFTVGANGNSLALDVSNLKTGGGGYYGSSGGGSKKSAADKLTERLGHGQNLYEHQIKMVQYEQTRYQNADELGNYGKMIQEEIEIEKAYLPVLESNIAALKSELSAVSEGSEDWYKLRDAILEAEEQYADINNTIDENEKKLEENQQAILKLHTDLEEMVVGEIELRIESEKEMLDGSVSMQDTILNAIKQRYQDEWDLIKQDIDKKKEALQQEKDLIDERLDARREAEDEAAKYEELAELKKQLSLISMDSTRTKDAAALRESIAELEKEIGWDIAEKEAENEKNAIQDQIDAYDDYVTSGDEDLEDLLSDANNFAEEVNGVLRLSQSELFEWLKQNVKDYANSLDDAQKQMVQSWEATYKQMLGITDTYWDEVNAILSAKDTFLEYMKQSEEYIYASDDERAQLLYQWGDAYDKWRLAQKNDANYSHGDSGLGDWSGSEYTGSSSSGGSSGGSGGSKNQYTGTPNESGFSSTQYADDNYKIMGIGTYGDAGITYNSDLNAAKEAAIHASKASGNVFTIYDSKGNVLYQYKDGKLVGSTSSSSGSGSSSSGGAGSLPETGWPSSMPGGHGYYYKVTKDGKNVQGTLGGPYSSREAAQAAAAAEAAKHKGKYQTKYFLHGGIADFTGPAWLDGTPSEPERILSADQTHDFETLVAIMDDFRNSGVSMDMLRSMAKWSTSVNIPTSLSHVGGAAYQGNSANIGDIFVNITEAQISDDRDIEELANIVGQKFVKEIGKQGFNVSRYNF